MGVMVRFGRGNILVLFVLTMLISGCGETQENTGVNSSANAASRTNANAAKSNFEELSLYVQVPYETVEIAWKQDPAKNIRAILRFTTKESDALVAEAEMLGQGQAVTVPVETWFPEELIAQGEVSGDDTLKGTAYAANAFFQEPYTRGRLIRIDGVDYFILEVAPQSSSGVP